MDARIILRYPGSFELRDANVYLLRARLIVRALALSGKFVP